MDPVSEPIIIITGEKVALGPIRRELVPLYLKWMNDFEVTRTLAARLRPVTREAEEAWYEGASKNDRAAMFTIYERTSMRPVGNTGLEEIDMFHRVAEFGLLIGEKDCWGQGYGTEVTTLMLDFGFSALGLHNIMLRVYSFNERGIRAYTRAGFREIGRRREAIRLGAQPHDEVLMDCLATEFQGGVMRGLVELPPAVQP